MAGRDPFLPLAGPDHRGSTNPHAATARAACRAHLTAVATQARADLGLDDAPIFHALTKETAR